MAHETHPLPPERSGVAFVVLAAITFALLLAMFVFVVPRTSRTSSESVAALEESPSTLAPRPANERGNAGGVGALAIAVCAVAVGSGLAIRSMRRAPRNGPSRRDSTLDRAPPPSTGEQSTTASTE